MDYRKDKEYRESYVTVIDEFNNIHQMPIKDIMNLNGEARKFHPKVVSPICDNMYLIHNLWFWKRAPMIDKSQYGFVMAADKEQALWMIKHHPSVESDGDIIELYNVWNLLQERIQEILDHQFWSKEKIDNPEKDTSKYELIEDEESE